MKSGATSLPASPHILPYAVTLLPWLCKQATTSLLRRNARTAQAIPQRHDRKNSASFVTLIHTTFRDRARAVTRCECWRTWNARWNASESVAYTRSSIASECVRVRTMRVVSQGTATEHSRENRASERGFHVCQNISGGRLRVRGYTRPAVLASDGDNGRPTTGVAIP